MKRFQNRSDVFEFWSLNNSSSKSILDDDLFEILEAHSTESYSSQVWSVQWRWQLFLRCEGTVQCTWGEVMCQCTDLIIMSPCCRDTENDIIEVNCRKSERFYDRIHRCRLSHITWWSSTDGGISLSSIPTRWRRQLPQMEWCHCHPTHMMWRVRLYRTKSIELTCTCISLSRPLTWSWVLKRIEFKR